MFALHIAPAPEPAQQLQSSLAAIVYANEEYPDEILKWIVSECRSRNLLLSGVLQHPVSEGADKRCDVLLEDLASGYRTLLFEDRGSGAKGCRLDVAALIDASMQVDRSLDNDPALLVLNKFGEVEAEDGGFCRRIA